MDDLGRGGGGCVCQTDDVEQGGVQKSVFARTSLMDNPLRIQIYIVNNDP